MRKLILLLCALFITMGAWAAVTTPTFTAVAPVNVTSGWYQIQWVDTGSDTNTDYSNAEVSGKYVTNYQEDATVSTVDYPLYLGSAPSNANEHAKTFVYYEQVGSSSGRGTDGYLRSANGHYVTQTGAASATKPGGHNYIIYMSSGTYPKNSVISSQYTGTRYSLIPRGKEATPYIGQTVANKFPMVQFSKVTPADLGLQPWTVSFIFAEGISGDNTQVEYTGSGIYGLTKVYDNGTFFIDSSTTPDAGDFSAPDISGYTATITVNSSTHTISVRYGVMVTYNLYESDGSTFVSRADNLQLKNSAVSIPAAIESTCYDYATVGTIGTEDCTIKVIRTPKSGYVVSLGGLNSAKCYNIRNNRGTWAVGSGATDVNSTVELDLAFLASDVKQQFAFIYYDESDDETNNGKYYLYSVGESKFAYVNGTKLSLTSNFTAEVAASPVTFGASTNSTYMYSEPIIVTVGDQMFGVSTDYSPDIYKWNDQADGGNCAYVIEADDFNASAATALVEFYFTHTLTYVVKDESANTLFTSDPINIYKGTYNTLPTEYHRDYFFTYATDGVTINDESSANTNLIFTASPKSGVLQYTANTSSPVYYNLNIRSKYLAYNDEATGDVELLDSSTPFNPDAAWAFIGDPYTGFKIINQTNGTDKYLTYTSVVTGRHSANNIGFVADANFTNQYWYVDANTGGFCLRMKENPNIYFHHDSGNNFLRTCSVSEWGSVHNDAGSTIVFASDEDVLVNLYNDLKDVFFADGVGKYTWGGSGTAEEARANINGAGSALALHATSSYKGLYDALLDIKENISLNTPAAGFYRIKGKTSNKYLAAGLAANSKFNMTTAEDATTIFYYDGTNLTNLSSGMCNGVNASNWAWVVGESASTVTFHDGHTSCGYGIQTATAYFYDNGDNSSSADRGTSVDMSSGDKRYRSWELTEITTLPVTISSVGYATFCSPVAVTIPSGVTAYIATLEQSDYLHLDEIEDGIIPANTGVVLAGNEGTYNFVITEEEGSAEDGLLEGTVAAIARPTDSYILATGGSGLGFYKDGASTIPGFKAYLPASAVVNVKGFLGFNFDDEETGIENLNENLNKNKAIFNLAGQRVAKPTQGLYIVNGKKVVIK